MGFGPFVGALALLNDVGGRARHFGPGQLVAAVFALPGDGRRCRRHPHGGLDAPRAALCVIVAGLDLVAIDRRAWVGDVLELAGDARHVRPVAAVRAFLKHVARGVLRCRPGHPVVAAGRGVRRDAQGRRRQRPGHGHRQLRRNQRGADPADRRADVDAALHLIDVGAVGLAGKRLLGCGEGVCLGRGGAAFGAFLQAVLPRHQRWRPGDRVAAVRGRIGVGGQRAAHGDRPLAGPAAAGALSGGCAGPHLVAVGGDAPALELRRRGCALVGVGPCQGADPFLELVAHRSRRCGPGDFVVAVGVAGRDGERGRGRRRFRRGAAVRWHRPPPLAQSVPGADLHLVGGVGREAG